MHAPTQLMQTSIIEASPNEETDFVFDMPPPSDVLRGESQR